MGPKAASIFLFFHFILATTDWGKSGWVCGTCPRSPSNFLGLLRVQISEIHVQVQVLETHEKSFFITSCPLWRQQIPRFPIPLIFATATSVIILGLVGSFHLDHKGGKTIAWWDMHARDPRPLLQLAPERESLEKTWVWVFWCLSFLHIIPTAIQKLVVSFESPSIIFYHKWTDRHTNSCRRMITASRGRPGRIFVQEPNRDFWQPFLPCMAFCPWEFHSVWY